MCMCVSVVRVRHRSRAAALQVYCKWPPHLCHRLVDANCMHGPILTVVCFDAMTSVLRRVRYCSAGRGAAL